MNSMLEKLRYWHETNLSGFQKAVELDDYNVYEIDLSGVTFFAGVNYYTSYQNQVILLCVYKALYI